MSNKFSTSLNNLYLLNNEEEFSSEIERSFIFKQTPKKIKIFPLKFKHITSTTGNSFNLKGNNEELVNRGNESIL